MRTGPCRFGADDLGASQFFDDRAGGAVRPFDVAPAVNGAPIDPVSVARVAKTALETQQEKAALPQVKAAAERLSNPRLWQWAGLLHRAIDEHRQAGLCFDQAARFAPNDAQIAHGRARVALEAGLSAVELFERAAQLAPIDGDLLLDLAAAQVAEGHVAQAIDLIDRTLMQHPGWTAGQQQLAHLRWMMGDREGFTKSLRRAIAGAPRDINLWHSLLFLLVHANRHDEMLAAIAEGRRMAGDSPVFDGNEAVALSDSGAYAAAAPLFDRLADLDDLALAVHHIRFLLRTGAVERAGERALPWASQPGGIAVMPYLSIVARLSGEPRWQRFAERLDLVGVYDLADRLPPLDRLADLLRSLHVARDQHLDQSVRGGTQTDGSLFTRIEPEIAAVRAAVLAAVQEHIAIFPPHDPADPTLAPRRDREPRFAGSWSVRLRGGGNHANHIHPAGWLSSALYISLPGEMNGEEGWLTLGEPQAELGLDLPPTRVIEPKPGRLVLFPSTMWHGTRPFTEGERLTVAFDVARPLG